MSADEELKKIVESVFHAPKGDLYHFTDKINEIVQSGIIKFSLHHHLNKNGHMELHSGKKLIINNMQKINCLKELVPRFKKYINEGMKVYTFSCCEDFSNEHLLTSFSKDYLTLKSDFIQHYYLKEMVILIGKVIYDSRKQKRVIRKLFTIYQKSNDSLIEKQKALFLWLSIAMPLLKPFKFRAENEVRFINIEIHQPNSTQLATEPCIKQIPLEYWVPSR